MEAGAARKDMRSIFDVLHPPDAKTTWKELPSLLGASFALVWESGRRQLLITSSIQLRSAVRALDRVLDAVTAADLLAFEDPEYHDRVRRAQMQGQMRSLQTVNGLVGIVGALVAAAGIVVALAAMQPLLVPLVVIGYLPLMLVTRLDTRDSYRVMWGMTPNDRQRQYLTMLMLGRDQAKEVRAFNLAPFLRRRYDDLYDERIAEARRLARRRTLRALAGTAITSLGGALALGFLAWLYVDGRLPLAAAGAAVFGLTQLTARMRSLHFSTSSLYEATLFIRDYRSFVDAPPPAEPEDLDPPRPFEGVRAEEVSFSYPQSARQALRRVSIEIAPGEIVALVGENGSGKTRLAKLLAGLYRPEEGTLWWSGEDAARLDPALIREQVAVIFQDFERNRLTARDNIALGRHARGDDAGGIEAAARQAEADEFIARLPDGMDTMLGREFFGGYDVSIGQWQRMAIARAFFRDAPLVILDEPTAALDARAESRLFARIRDPLAVRSVLLISHRFSSVASADRIYVLDQGQVVEHGTHEELMAAEGAYAELYLLQAAAYLKRAGRESVDA